MITFAIDQLFWLFDIGQRRLENTIVAGTGNPRVPLSSPSGYVCWTYK